MHKDFMIASMDLISGLAEGLGTSLEGLVDKSNLIDLLLRVLAVRIDFIYQKCNKNLFQFTRTPDPM
jgi:hypothetical protein